MLHELGNHDADGKEIEEDGDESPEDDDTKEDEDDTNIPLRHHARYGLVFLGYRCLCLLIVHAEVTEYAQIVVASIIEDAVLDIFVSAVGIVVECL